MFAIHPYPREQHKIILRTYSQTNNTEFLYNTNMVKTGMGSKITTSYKGKTHRGDKI